MIELLTRKTPFSGTTNIEVIQQIVYEKRYHKIPPQSPAEYQEILRVRLDWKSQIGNICNRSQGKNASYRSYCSA